MGRHETRIMSPRTLHIRSVDHTSHIQLLKTRLIDNKINTITMILAVD